MTPPLQEILFLQDSPARTYGINLKISVFLFLTGKYYELKIAYRHLPLSLTINRGKLRRGKALEKKAYKISLIFDFFLTF